jgi:deoxyribodipyrimidine photo-lyase
MRAPVRAAGKCVLYWIIAARRLHYNFAVERALEHCREFGKPLVIFEALRCGYRWASDKGACLPGLRTNGRQRFVT